MFPPRLPSQPIFYPVLNEDYAVEIARDWNTKDAASGYAGYVTRVCILASFLARYEVQTVGARRHPGVLNPRREQKDMHRHMVGPIEMIVEFHGPKPTSSSGGRSALASLQASFTPVTFPA